MTDEKTAQQVLDSLPRAVFELEGRKILFVNAAAQKIFGWLPEELIGKTTEILYRSKEEYDHIGAQLYLALEKEQSFEGVYPCRNKDGRDIICNVNILRLGNGLEKEKVIVMYEDITERIEAEKELQESEEQYRNFVENTHEIVQSMSLEGKFLTVNNAWRKSFEYSKEDMQSLNMFDIVEPSYKQRLDDTFNAALLGQPILNVEIHFMNKSKQEIILEGNFIPRTFYGKVINIKCFFRDITENRKVQQEINDKIDELEMFNRLAVDRELKMIELKSKIQELESRLNHTNASSIVASE